MHAVGSTKHPVIVKVKTAAQVERVAAVCEAYGFRFIVGMEPTEDLTDLYRAIRERTAPADVYAPCPCGSGAKYKFCCANKPVDLDI